MTTDKVTGFAEPSSLHEPVTVMHIQIFDQAMQIFPEKIQ